MKDLVQRKLELRAKEKEIYETWKAESVKVRKQITNINKELAAICEHDFKRDNYLYAPLYCRHCLLEKEEVIMLNRRSNAIQP